MTTTTAILFDFVEGKVLSREDQGEELDRRLAELAELQSTTEVTGSTLLSS